MTLTLLASCGSKKEEITTDTAAESTTVAESAAESEYEPKIENVRVLTLKGPTGMGLSKLMEDDENSISKLDYTFSVASSPDEITGEILKGDYEVACLPTNLAAVLYSKAPDNIRIAAVNTLGVLSLLENGNSIQSIEDLNGKTVYLTGQGSTPEYIVNYIFDAFNIDCNIEYLTDHSELATKMIEGIVDIGILPVPNSTTVLAKSEARTALDLNELWKKAAEIKGDDNALYQGCVVINKSFADQYPDDVEMFMKEYADSVDFVNGNDEEASALISKFEIIPAQAIAKKAIGNAGIVFINGDEMIKGLDGFYNVLYKYDPKSVGGKVPDENIYYK